MVNWVVRILKMLFGWIPLFYESMEVGPLGSEGPKPRQRIIFYSTELAMGFGNQPETIYHAINYIAENVGGKATVHRPFQGKEQDDFNMILAKNWGSNSGEIESNVPGLLFIETDFDDFDPSNDKWILIGLSELFTETGEVGQKLVQDFMKVLIQVLNQEGESSLFNFLEERAKGQRIAQFGKCFEIKPGIFGFSFDLGKFLKQF